MGALTSKPYAFSARPWELSDAFAVDYLDTLHAPIRLSTRGGELLRILPDLRYSFLNEWISDRSRFSYDSVSCNRIGAFGFSFRTRFAFYPVSKVYLLNFLLARSSLFSGPAFDFFGFDQVLFGVRMLTRSGLQLVDSRVDFRSSYTPGIQLMSSSAALTQKALFVVGLSLRYTHPVLFARLKQLKKLGVIVFDFGEALSGSDYSFGSSLKNFLNFFRFKLRSGVLVDNAVFISSLRLVNAFPHFFNPVSTLSLAESPTLAIFAEVALRIYSSFGVAPRYNIIFSPYALKANGFVIPVAHFYESNFTVLSDLLPGQVRSEPALSSSHFFYDFFNFISHERRPSIFAPFLGSSDLIPLSFASYTSVYLPYNYHDHFFGHVSLRNSTNILLNLRRNEDYRHTHFCSF